MARPAFAHDMFFAYRMRRRIRFERAAHSFALKFPGRFAYANLDWPIELACPPWSDGSVNWKMMTARADRCHIGDTARNIEQRIHRLPMYPHPESNKKTSLQPSKQNRDASKAATATERDRQGAVVGSAEIVAASQDITAQVLIFTISELSPQ